MMEAPLDQEHYRRGKYILSDSSFLAFESHGPFLGGGQTTPLFPFECLHLGFRQPSLFLYHLPYPSGTNNHDRGHGSSHTTPGPHCPSSRTWPSIPTPVSITHGIHPTPRVCFPIFWRFRAWNVKMVACQAAC